MATFMLLEWLGSGPTPLVILYLNHRSSPIHCSLLITGICYHFIHQILITEYYPSIASIYSSYGSSFFLPISSFFIITFSHSTFLILLKLLHLSIIPTLALKASTTLVAP